MTLSPTTKFLTPLLLAAALALGGCTGSDDGDPAASSENDPGSDAAVKESNPDGRIVDSGFVQDAELVQTMTLVEDTSTTAGQTSRWSAISWTPTASSSAPRPW